jgi:hypothetical protein
MLPYKFISEFILAARVFVVWNCWSAAAAAEEEFADVPFDSVLAVDWFSGAAVTLCTAVDAPELGLARLLSVELMEMSWSNWFNETS